MTIRHGGLSMKSRRLIAVIGGHLSNTNHEALRVAEYTGRVLADLDLAVICGGEDGIMEAICRGCKSSRFTQE